MQAWFMGWVTNRYLGWPGASTFTHPTAAYLNAPAWLICLLLPRVEGSELVFRASASPTLERRLRALGGRREGGFCRVPAGRILDFEDLFGYGGIAKDDDYNALRLRVYFGCEQAEQVARATILHQDPGSLDFAGLTVPLYPYQARAVRFLQRAERGILGDEPGLGKTLQAIAWAIGHGPTLVVCPAGVSGVWQAELTGKSKATVGALRGTAAAPIPQSDFVIVSISVVQAHLAALKRQGFRSIIVDEAHQIKDLRSQRTKAVTSLTETIPRRLFLSGTLLLRSAEDMFPILRLVRPDEFPSLAIFRSRYCKTTPVYTRAGRKQKVVGSQRTEEFRRRMEPWMAARRLSEVVEDLPPLTEQTISVELSAEQAVRYKACVQRMRSEARRSRAGITAFQEATRVLQEAKTEAAKAILDDFWFSDRKALAFSHMLEPLDKLESKAWSDISIRLTGSVSPEERTRRVGEFQTNPRIRLALCQLEAAGVGITLDAADTVLMVDPGWTPALVEQAVHRARRVTTKHPVHVIHFVVAKTLDEARWERMRNAATRSTTSTASKASSQPCTSPCWGNFSSRRPCRWPPRNADRSVFAVLPRKPAEEAPDEQCDGENPFPDDGRRVGNVLRCGGGGSLGDVVWCRMERRLQEQEDEPHNGDDGEESACHQAAVAPAALGGPACESEAARAPLEATGREAAAGATEPALHPPKRACHAFQAAQQVVKWASHEPGTVGRTVRMCTSRESTSAC